MKRLKRGICTVVISNIVFLCSKVNAVLAASPDLISQDEPARLRGLEGIFVTGLVAIWIFSVPYFIYVISSLGFLKMFSLGDEQKEQSFKQRAGRVPIAAFLVFGGYVVVRTIMSLVMFQNPNPGGGGDCFESPLSNVPIFQFFFPDICTGD